ncbi:hypothetical protein PG996_014679 [Apiospora saccharicola]|uniref:Uncharacterized protein n=1 Tax=Apiospora saccharicola TaxID=335842 RepID=A0ABR1TIZ3_9PEZI
MSSISSTPQAASPSKPLSRTGISANGGGNGQDEDDDSTWTMSPRTPSRASSRTLGPRSWIIYCTRINDRITNDLSRLCALKGQVAELLNLSSQVVPSTRRWINWFPSTAAGAETEKEEDFDREYDERLERLAAEPDVLVDELRVLQKALGATLPATRRGSVDWGSVAKAKAGAKANGGASASAGTYEELERLRIRWATLSKRVIALSSHVDGIVKAAAAACRKSRAHLERPALVARLKRLVAEAQPGDVYKQYDELRLGQVLEQVYPHGRPELEISTGDRPGGRKMSPSTFISAAAAELIRAVPIPKPVLETTVKVIRGTRLATGFIKEQLAWIPRTLFLSRALVYLRVYLVSLAVALPLSFYCFEAPPEIWA